MWPHGVGRRRAAAIVIATMAALSLNGCAWWQWTLGGAGGVAAYSVSRFNHLYAKQYREAGVAPFQNGDADVRLAFIESDDHGWFQEPAQARVALDTVEALSRSGNVAVIVYVHGWRHNASKNDTDVEAFKQTLAYLGDRLNHDDFRRVRSERTGDPTTTIVGLYIGWRGKSVPEMPGLLAYINFPVFLSFWNRKDAAHVVGRGDVREFLLHLDDLYTRVNYTENGASSSKSHLMSLVIIGHSFGGQIVFDATRDRLEGHLYGALDACGGTSSLSERLYPDTTAERHLVCDELVRGFGDLVVLINPAFEADAYRRIDDIVQAVKFDAPQQEPRLITVSAEDDNARKQQFASARGLSLWGDKRTASQSKLLGHALGVYGPQVTHALVLRDERPETKARANRKLLDALRDRHQTANADGGALLASIEPIQIRQSAIQIAPEDAELLRLKPLKAQFDHQPAIVIRASKEVIHGHSDFFRVGFVSWLSAYVLHIQYTNLQLEAGTRRRAK